MKNINIRYASAENFICFREKVEFYFQDYGNIVLILGENYDTIRNNEVGSNASGKSTTMDIISYAIYGKTVKSPKKIGHKDVIHNWTGKNLKVEIEIDDYKITRTRKPDSLKLWYSKDRIWDETTELTLGTSPETQKKIEEIIGLSHEAFCNIVVFDDSSTSRFIELDASSKRNIVENLLDISKYAEYLENAKNIKKDLKTQIDNYLTQYDSLKSELNGLNSSISDISQKEKTWKNTKKQEINDLNNRIKEKQDKLTSLDINKEIEKYNQIQLKIKEIEETLSQNEEKRTKVLEMIKQVRERIEKTQDILSEHNLKAQEYKNVINSCKNEISSHENVFTSLGKLNSLEKCPVCYGKIDPKNHENVFLHSKNIVESQKQLLNKHQDLFNSEFTKVNEQKSILKKYEEALESTNSKYTAFENKNKILRKELNDLNKVQKPQLTTEEKVLEDLIIELKLQLKSKEEELSVKSPYEEILINSHNKLKEIELKINNKKSEIKEKEDEIPYVDYWIKGFGDKGIRKFIIDKIVPALNNKLEYWMQYLMDDQIKIVFNNEFEEKIDQKPADGNPFVYYTLSNGEKQRINLSLALAFSYIRALNYGTCPSVLFLDEITKGAIDKNGVQGLYNMILELAKERQVFITTHDVNLLNLLEGFDTIRLKKKDGFTTLIKK